MSQTETVANYLELPWTYTVETSQRAESTVFVIRVNELPEVCADALSLEAAMDSLRPVLVRELERRIAVGASIPEPLALEQCKGKVAYRTTPERHYKLAKEARRRSMSLSRLIDYCIDEKL